LELMFTVRGAVLEQAPLRVAILCFADVDQLDATGPFEVFANLRNAAVSLVAVRAEPVRDMRGLVLSPNASFDTLPSADVLIVPGGTGQEALMDDEVTLAWVRRIAAGAQLVLSVCTGALVLGAAGLLVGRRATTHWAAHDLLWYFGAVPVSDRVVCDGSLITTAGVTAGIDGALRAVAMLRGEATARAIQLGMEYAPRPPFAGGTPQSTPSEIRERISLAVRPLHDRREQTARRIRERLGLDD
jgi:cyclohexyl-isocyanide hydratase